MKKKIVIILAFFMFLSVNANQYTQQDAQRYSAYYSNGMQYYQNQQFSSAITEFKKVLRFSPYDATIQEALANSYLARAQYYRITTKEVKKALNDYKSAVFYTKYWNTKLTDNMAQLVNTCQHAINDFEKRLANYATPQQRLQNAKVLRAQGELASAGYDFQQLMDTSYRPQAQANLIKIYKILNNVAQSMEYVKVALDEDPKNAKLHFEYGVMLDEAKNFEASIEQYNLAFKYGDQSPELLEILENKWTQNIVNKPTDAQNYNNLGAIYQKQGDLENAKVQYSKAYQLNPTDETTLYNLASLYVQMKNYQSANSVYDKLLTLKPKNVELLNYKAQALKELMRYDEALAQYDKILALNPNDSNAKSAKENIIYNNFTGEKLQGYLLSLAQTNPKNYEAQFNYALEMHKAQNYTNAVAYYKKALSLNPGKEEVYLNLAQIYLEQKKYNEANDICLKGLLALPNNEKLTQCLNEAESYLVANQFDKATKLFEQGNFQGAVNEYLKIKDQTKEVKEALASSYWQMNDYKNANKYYLEILQAEPKNTEILLNVAYAYYSMEEIDKAKETLNKLLSIDKTNEEGNNLLKQINETEIAEKLQLAIQNYEQGNFEASLSLLNDYLTKKPKDEYANYYKGLNLEELKKTQEAIKQYKHLISLNAEFENAYYSLAVVLDNLENYKEAVNYYQKFVSLKGETKDEMTQFAQSRIKELNEYLAQLNGNKK